MRLALLAIDAREAYQQYEREDPYFGSAPAALIDGFKDLPGLEVHVVTCTRRPMVSPKELAANVFFHSVLVPKWGWMRTLYLGCRLAVRRRLRQIQPDIVHGQGTERESAVCAAFSGFPNVITLHGNMRAMARHYGSRPFSYHWLAGRLESAAVARSNGVVCISTYTQRLVQASARQTWLLPNAVDPSFFALAPQPASPPVLLCVGSICREKGQIALIRALDDLARERQIRLRFFGQPVLSQTYGSEFEALIKDRPWCECPGFASVPELVIAMQEATCLVHPTLEDNCPMVVLEAMAAGLPVIASRIGGVPDLVEPGVTGWLCNPENSAEFAHAVTQLLDDSTGARALGESGRRQARERFHPRFVAERHLEIYREVVKKADSRARR
ncbi:MAG: glycosyltransferase family 4 protein [Chthoniobacteraceae bacterium]